MTSTRTTEIRVDLVAGLVPLLFVAGATWWRFGLAAGYVVQTVGLYGLMAGAIAVLGPRRLGDRPGEPGEPGGGGEGDESGEFEDSSRAGSCEPGDAGSGEPRASGSGLGDAPVDPQ